MAVEILILSGARQGERIALDAEEFRVGADPGVQVFFDPQHDPTARGRSALFRLTDEGWLIRRTGGGEILVNQQPVIGPMRIRSGDVVRLSELGPDFTFSIVPRTTVTAAVASTPPAALPSPAPLPPPVAPAMAVCPPPSTPLPVGKPEEKVLPVAQPVAPTDPWRFMKAAGAGAAFLVLVVVLIALLSRPSVIIVQGEGASPRPTDAKPAPESSPPKPPPSPAPAETAKPPVAGEAKPAAVSPVERVKAAVFLILVEKADHRWPFATCCAVDDHTLVTTAREAVQLAQWQQQGFKLWITQPGAKTDQEPRAVRDLRVHGVFATLADKPGDWIYVDLALLTVDGPIPEASRLELASSEELAEVDEGCPIACVGYTHDGQRVTRYTQLEPQVTEGAVFIITVERELAASPRLLHLSAKIPPNAYGSPIVTRQGKLIGLFGETAVRPEAKDAAAAPPHIDHLQYAPLVTRELIANPRLWRAPQLPASSSPAPNASPEPR